MLKEIWSIIRHYFRRLDKSLLLLCAAALVFGCTALYSETAAEFLTKRKFTTQVFCAGVGVCALLFLSAVSYRFLAKLWFLHLPATLGLVLLTFVGPSSIVYRPDGSDDAAWLRFGSLSLQPSELLKFSFILTFALHLSKVREDIDRPGNILLLCLHGAFPCLLIFLQGDMGSALVFFFIFVCMIFVSGISYRYVFLGLGALAVGAPVLWYSGLIPDYLKNRFLVLGDLENASLKEAYQQLVGRRILGSGRIFGKGLFSDDLAHVFALENDLILAHIGQTLGFVGCAAVILLLTAICVKILLVARASKDALGCYICTGVFAMLLFQVIINMGMVLCVLPVIGITLPFFSQGGTSLITTCLSVGLCMSVSAYNRPSRS
ncbi:MAG: FtsW/RodA/SpoVE family cell cycle protein [Oscillospiraceae bacterium]|nr:FtsW/RodA/SpoVE family cell cycle protein [Oscillospiraceae bacterium]